MSRSRKKYGVRKENGRSHKWGKRKANRAFRRTNKVRLQSGREDIIPILVIMNQWDICDWKSTWWHVKKWHQNAVSNPIRFSKSFHNNYNWEKEKRRLFQK